MHISILTFEGYNELDSLIAFGIFNRFVNLTGESPWLLQQHSTFDE